MYYVLRNRKVEPSEGTKQKAKPRPKARRVGIRRETSLSPLKAPHRISRVESGLPAEKKNVLKKCMEMLHYLESKAFEYHDTGCLYIVFLRLSLANKYRKVEYIVSTTSDI